MLYRRDRTLEVVPVDGINGPAVEGEAPLETLEDAAADEQSELLVAEAVDVQPPWDGSSCVGSGALNMRFVASDLFCGAWPNVSVKDDTIIDNISRPESRNLG